MRKMIAIIFEHIVLSTSILFSKSFQYFNKLLLFHLCLSQINFSVKVVISTLRINHDDSAFISICRNYTETVLLATFIKKIVLDLNPCMIATKSKGRQIIICGCKVVNIEIDFISSHQAT